MSDYAVQIERLVIAGMTYTPAQAEQFHLSLVETLESRMADPDLLESLKNADLTSLVLPEIPASLAQNPWMAGRFAAQSLAFGLLQQMRRGR